MKHLILGTAGHIDLGKDLPVEGFDRMEYFDQEKLTIRVGDKRLLRRP